MVKNVLSRAPDSSDLAHRRLCDLMVLSDQDFGEAVGGAEAGGVREAEGLA